jgi:hypothetical protein
MARRSRRSPDRCRVEEDGNVGGGRRVECRACGGVRRAKKDAAVKASGSTAAPRTAGRNIFVARRLATRLVGRYETYKWHLAE